MAAPTRTRVLNLGMQTVALAEFHTSPDGSLTLDRIQVSELLADPGADASRPGQIEATIGEMKKNWKSAGGEINYALPSQSVFSRYLGLPGSTPEDLNQIIGFEAQQNIPFPIDEVVWDYQPLGQPVDGKLNVVLVAMKTDALEAVNAAVESAGFAPQTIDLAPMALVNAFRYNYPDAQGCSLIVDIGARTTNLLFIEGEKTFTRSIPIGGSTITGAVAKEFGQPFEAAELIKKEKGFVGLGGSYADPEDEIVARISKLARTSLTRLHADIARSISFYRANQHGSQPSRVYLAGGAASMPYMLEFFSEKMQMPIEFLNPFRNVKVASTADVQLLSTRAHALGETVGLALRDAGNCPIELNLRPPTVVNAQALDKRKPFLIAATACLFLGILMFWVYYWKAAAVHEEVLASIDSELSGLESQAAAFDAAKRSQEQLAAIADPLITASIEREIWVRIIDELGTKLPPDFIWITRLTPLSNGRPVTISGALTAAPRTAAPTPTPRPRPGQPASARPAEPPPVNGITALQIDGLYFNNPNQAKVIDDFVNNLEKSELFAVDPQKKTEMVTVRKQPDDETWAYAYQIILPLKNPIALP
jgi:type IV pilus assembly protein PilM